MRITKKFLRDCGFTCDEDDYDTYWYYKNENVLINYRQHAKSMVWFNYRTQETVMYQAKTRETFLKVLTLYGVVDGRFKNT